MSDPTGEVTDLLQHLIRNACVNDGTPESGHEVRSVDTLAAYLQAPGLELQRYEPTPGRGSLVLRIEGSDPKAPTLMLMGHLDVVPVDLDGWSHDPFAGELADGVVWGRGAIDMLDVTAAMAVAVRGLLRGGFRPNGTLVYAAMADEEAFGTHGAQWLLEHEWDAVRADYVVTEFGGMRLPTEGPPVLPIIVAEKGVGWVKLRVHGTPGHGSMPYATDNALVKAARVVDRIAGYRPPRRFLELWTHFVEGMRFPEPLTRGLLQEELFDRAIAGLPVGLARMYDASTHTTFAPTMLKAGQKINVIPAHADLEVDIRTLPGDDRARVREMLAEAIGDLWSEVEIVDEGNNPATESPINTPLYDAIARVSARLVPGATTVPTLLVGATDSRFYRRKGVTAYGAGLMSERIPFGQFATMFHGDDERVDQETLRLCTELFAQLPRELLL